ncbi:cyclodeaminase/cyclohydrolase family protein [Collimonas humicola]|uniref:cyclodeaminase/cyclohydrolase family protein n=1 Tax=Collimonas humicola TaxID=2825886 RepID=UPI001B8BED07|nr:cyclodeaminase/cyclohydrolase family protein [Collimonas humicola]
MEENEEAFNNELLARPAGQLLNDFGAGHASPGSGSAAALLALLAAKMITTVCEISARKPECQKYLRDFGQIVAIIKDEIEPKLRHLFEQDAKDFDKVVGLRIARDEATDQAQKTKLAKESLDLLEVATNYTFEVGDLSVRLMTQGIAMFENGWHAVRGDSGVAISAAMSAVMSSIFIIKLNLKTLKRRNYARSSLERSEELRMRLAELQTQAFKCVAAISTESIESIQLELAVEVPDQS